MSTTKRAKAAASSASNVAHVDLDGLPDWMQVERTRILTGDVMKPKSTGKCVLYWMQRDVRSVDNWALLFASHMAKSDNVPLMVCYALPPPPDSDEDDGNLPPKTTEIPLTERYGTFMLGGLESVHKELAEAAVPFHIMLPTSSRAVGDALMGIVDQHQPRVVITDFSPLRQFREWNEDQAVPLLREQKLPLFQVDAHNVVPVWTATDKREVGARTLRPRIHKLLPQFLTPFPDFEGNSHVGAKPTLPPFEKDEYLDFLRLDPSVKPVAWAQPGTEAGMQQFHRFCRGGLKNFDKLRNNPTERGICSSLSPWINMGHVSFQRIAMDVKSLNKYANGTASFIEEGLVRRELSDNFVFYAPDNYDSLESAAQWAQDSLELHASDEREYIYSLEQFERGETHDDLWNAAELQLLQEGKLHGFLRMYWAKKILEWTPSPSVALRTAQYLNDKYALDGNDPNGFVGVGWSIMGIHDMGWKERPIFGKIRFMNYAGCKRKFKVNVFVDMYKGAKQKAMAAQGNTAKTSKQSGKKRSRSEK